MPLSSIFLGAPQSKYAAFAILAAVLVVSFSLLFGKDPIPFTQKLAFVFLLFLISLPGILMTLFQMTCLVTGSGLPSRDNPLGKRWWCSVYAWVISVLLIVYCVMLIAVAVIALTTGEKVLSEIAVAEVEHFENAMKEANKEAKQYFVGDAKVEDIDPALVKPVKDSIEDTGAEEKKEEVATFKVAGGASEPADINIPEGFEESTVEMFTSGCAPY